MDPNDPNFDPGTSGAIAGAIFAIYAAFVGFLILFGIAYYVVWALAFGQFFRKVGLPAWTAWVPYYNRWRLLEVGGFPGWISLANLVGLGVVSEVFIWIGMYRLQFAFRKSAGHLAWGILVPPVWGFIMGARATTYDPALMVAAGYAPPLVGYGAVPRTDAFGFSTAGPPPGYAQPGYAQPGYPQQGYPQAQQPGYSPQRGYPDQSGQAYPQPGQPGQPHPEQHSPQDLGQRSPQDPGQTPPPPA